jgi:hypothetical protein
MKNILFPRVAVFSLAVLSVALYAAAATEPAASAILPPSTAAFGGRKEG